MSNLSLDGLATGMATEDIINQLVELEKQPIYAARAEITELETEKGVWRDVNSRIDNLENTLTDLKLSSTYNSNTAASSDENVATATVENSAAEATYNIDVSKLATVHRIASDKQTDSSSALSLSGDIMINGKTVSVEATDSLSDISTAINETEDIGVQASIIDDNLVLEAGKTGTANEITLTDNDDILEDLGVLDTGKNIKNELQAAADASLSINGVDVSSASNDIEDTVDGVDFTIKDSGSTTITVNRDTDKAVSAVQAFVDQYNSVMDFMDTKLAYDSETGEAGALQGDSTLTRLQSNLRSMTTDTVDTDSDYDQLAMVGINVDRDGVMSFDSSKLTEALEDSPEDVINLFKAEKDDEGFDGVAIRLDSYVDQLVQTNTGTIPRQIDYYEGRVEDLNEDIEDYERQVEQTRERYIEEFTAMETAISDMQQQQSWLMSQLSSLNSTTNSSMMSSMM